MKINLLKTNLEPLYGYINISPHATPDQKDIAAGDILSLDHILDAGEAEELLALDIIDFIPYNLIDHVLSGWISKLAHKGEMVVGGVETYSLCKAFAAGSIELAHFNGLVFGDGSTPWSQKKFIYGMDFLKTCFVQKGLKLLDIKISNLRYSIRAQRP